MIGQTISHYRITEKLGEGGMGVVYKAQDTKLDRAVALKFLAPHLLRDEEGRKRFQREAKAAAALDHPNICTVHEIDEVDGKTFIVMAFLEGQPLSKKVAEGPLKLNEALAIAEQIAEGLEAAHERGVVHRDIKPDNVMLLRGSRGLVKIMDFGLAQLAGSSKLTRGGSTLGTMAYMSPEQAQGANVDRRSDIWSLGVVLYEMVSGQPPFRGDFDQAVVYSIVNEPAEPLTAVRTGVPKELERIVDKCLAKGPDHRYQRVEDMVVDLRRLRKERESTVKPHLSTPAVGAAPSRNVWYAAAAALLAVIAMSGFLGSRFFAPSALEVQTPLRPVPLTSYAGIERDVTFSPDGSQVAFSWNGNNEDNFDVYVQVIGSGDPLRLTTGPPNDVVPSWSPDGRYISFVRRSGGEANLYIVPPLGGTERRIAELSLAPVRASRVWRWLELSATSAWGPDSRSVLLSIRDSVDDPWSIQKLSIETGERQPVTSPPAEAFGDEWYAISSDGKWLGFVRTTNQGLFGDIFVKPLEGGEEKRLTFLNQTFYGLAWTPADDGIVFSAGDFGAAPFLWRVPLAGGEPQQVGGIGSGAYSPAISNRAKRLVYEQRQLDTNIWRYDMPEKGRATAPEKLIGSTQLEASPRISPDAKKIVYYSTRSGSREIWICDADGSNEVQLTSFGGQPAGSPSWSPDGRQITFDASPKGNWDVFVISAEGGSPRALTSHEGEDSRPSWSRDGRWIYFNSLRSGREEIWKLPVEGGEPVQVTANGGYHPVESPDGLYLYYGKRAQYTLYRAPVEGGEEEVVIRGVVAAFNGWYAFGSGGIYYVNLEDQSLSFLDLDSSRTRTLMALPVGVWDSNALALAPDGEWFLYVQADLVSSDLMLVEDFR